MQEDGLIVETIPIERDGQSGAVYRTSDNHYLHAISGEIPEEIIAYETASDPYANMLPGISSVRAAHVLSRELESERPRDRTATILSIVMLTALLLPGALALISQLTH